MTFLRLLNNIRLFFSYTSLSTCVDFAGFARFVMQNNETKLHLSAGNAATCESPAPRLQSARSLILKCVWKHEPFVCLFGACCISALNAFKALRGPAHKSDHLLRLGALEILSHHELAAVHLLLVNVVKS